jgi:glycerophosphoryl diester phosphodiesterase
LREVSLNAPPWLTARPIAHRGLHDIVRGVVENTLGAAEAAAAANFAIECDVQASADSEAIVFHDDTLDRLTEGRGRLDRKTAREIASVSFRSSAERIPTFRALLARIAGRTPVICEIKSAFDGDMRLAEQIALDVGDYAGPVALKSFDPAIIAYFRRAARPPASRSGPCPLGVVSEARYDHEDWRILSEAQKINFANFLHYPETRPDFLSYCVDDLPHATPFLLRTLGATPVLAWTVRTPAQKQRAAQWADQIIFEGTLET